MVTFIEEKEKNPSKTLLDLKLIVKNIFKKKIPIEILGIELNEEDISRLKEGIWLNNKIISAYLEIVSKHFRKEGLNVFILSTHFYKNILECDSFKIIDSFKNYNFKKYDFVVIPIHLKNHWTICIVDLEARNFEYYDSISSSSPKSNKNLNILRIIKKNFCKYSSPKFSTFSLKDKSEFIPKQENSFDCGVYCCFYVRYRLENENFNFSQNNTTILRNKILLELYLGKIVYSNHFIFL